MTAGYCHLLVSYGKSHQVGYVQSVNIPPLGLVAGLMYFAGFPNCLLYRIQISHVLSSFPSATENLCHSNTFKLLPLSSYHLGLSYYPRYRSQRACYVSAIKNDTLEPFAAFLFLFNNFSSKHFPLFYVHSKYQRKTAPPARAKVALFRHIRHFVTVFDLSPAWFSKVRMIVINVNNGVEGYFCLLNLHLKNSPWFEDRSSPCTDWYTCSLSEKEFAR